MADEGTVTWKGYLTVTLSIMGTVSGAAAYIMYLHTSHAESTYALKTEIATLTEQNKNYREIINGYKVDMDDLDEKLNGQSKQLILIHANNNLLLRSRGLTPVTPEDLGLDGPD